MMDITIHKTGDISIAEITATEVVINNTEDALQIMGDLYYQDVERIILHEKNITPAFFDLKNGIAGEILQKFTNYRIRLAIVGEFTKYPGKSIKDFIYESNKGRQVNFLDSTELALEKLSG
ncbi:DUF4180 domain-containing protein [Chitinophaga sp. HK235]|uniref:DUF4180 domain-containing protein n=1 Tax=Chitinophaga sp. HK235 TaxID=2952571 RepID=UPI001BA80850|nr:DUF4180 domain-containing protein [Chitinophaga sp. HK235]